MKKREPEPLIPALMTTQDLADYLKVHRTTIYRMMAKGQLPQYFRIGADFRWNKETVREWCQARSAAGMPL